MFANSALISNFALSLGGCESRGLVVPYFITIKMITDKAIIKLIEEYIQETDIFLVEVAVKPGNAIRVHVDRPDGISIDECVKISRFLNSRLDRDEEDYSLEISSPGLGASFGVIQQYRKNIGSNIEVLLNDGSKITGRLLSVSDPGIVIKIKGEEKELLFKEIKSSKAIVSFK